MLRIAHFRTIALFAMLAGLAAFAAYALGGAGRGSIDGPMGEWVGPAIQILAAGLAVAWGARRPSERVAWSLLAAGMVVSAAGDVWYALFLADLSEPPFPSFADALYLAYYPVTYAGLILLLRARATTFNRSVWLDGLIGGLGVAAVTAALLLKPIIATTEGSFAAVAVNLAYPAGDLLLLALIMIGSALLGRRAARGWYWLAAALSLWAVADSYYLYQVAVDSYVAGHWLDLLWPLGAALMVPAAWAGSRAWTDLREPGSQEGWLLIVPVGWTLAAGAVLIHDHFTRVSLVAIVLAGLTLVASLVRTVLTFYEVRALADSRRQALTDDLTGLANRRAFYEQVDGALEQARSGHAPLSLLVVDLDRFKELNDTLGHHAGDLVLRQVGPRVRGAVPGAHTIARLGGDEFAVLLTDRPGEADSLAAAGAIRAALESSFEVDEVTVHVEASVGIAMYPQHGEDAGLLLRHADIAMYQAKETRSGAELYAADRDQHSRERLSLMGELRTALRRGELVVYYQPKADLRTARVTGAEALVRWQHPERGLLFPDQFLPMAEQTGLMRPLTLYVLERALRQTRAWHDAGRPLSIAVNLGVPNLLDLQLPGDVARLLEETGVAPRYLELEITENVVMADPVRTIQVLKALRELGVGLSLDDFGTGYSSLAYLKRLAVDELKIDKSFVMQMANDEDDAVIVRSTVDLALNLGLRVVAEGVEDEQSWRALERMGCEVAQGYYLSKPVPADQFGEWLGGWDEQALAVPEDDALAVVRVPGPARLNDD
jgi:diguanylate cyclase (GGDEF)-like protein